jgi:hypothetical protein
MQQYTIKAIEKKPSSGPSLAKEKTAREKAMEFAKNNIPKPRQRRESNNDDSEDYYSRRLDDDQYRMMEEPMNHYEGMGDGSTGTEANSYQRLAEKHEHYQDEIEKIKALLAD